jgi:hypothetical protein
MARESHGAAAKRLHSMTEGRFLIWVDPVTSSGRLPRGDSCRHVRPTSSALGCFTIDYSTIRKICHWLVPDTT